MHRHQPDPVPRAARTTLGVAVGAAAILLVAMPSQAQTAAPPSRGQLLYSAHCVACHDTQKHWRDKPAVRNWDGLVGQVRLWQNTLGLRWADADITDVARHLNERYYKLPEPGARQGRRPAPGAASA
jgi:hypothetical protein